MTAVKLATLAGCLLALAGGYRTAAASAVGYVHTDPEACSGAVATSGSQECPDTIQARVSVAPPTVGEPGSIFVVILPIAHGKPTTYKGAYATPDGWVVSIDPSAYYTGPLPPADTITLSVPGGICADAIRYAAGATLGVFAGYGASARPAPSADREQELQALLRETQRLHDPSVTHFIATHVTNSSGTGRGVVAGEDAASMLKHHTVWQIGTVHCE